MVKISLAVGPPEELHGPIALVRLEILLGDLSCLDFADLVHGQPHVDNLDWLVGLDRLQAPVAEVLGRVGHSRSQTEA